MSSQEPHAPHGHPAREHHHGHRHGHGGPHTHGHPHPHPHSHLHEPARGHDRAFALGIALNLGFVAIEAGYGWQVDSLALLADAGHNLGDVAGLVLAWGGALAGRLRPDARHTYGWKRASLLAAFLNALLLLVAMGALGWEALQRLSEAAPASEQGLTIVAVAAVGIGVNTATALLFLRGQAQDLNIRGAFLHMVGDALVSLGVVIAGLLTWRFGWAWLDPVVSLGIVVVIVLGTWGLLRQSLHLLFDGVPDGVDLGEVQALLEGLPGVERVHDLHVWAMGSTETALTAHLLMPKRPADDLFLADAAQQLQARFGIAHVTLQAIRTPFTPSCAARPSIPA